MRLGARQADGCTLREHLLAAAAAGAPPDPMLRARPVPRSCQALLTAFAQLAAARPAGGMGAAAIPPSEIDAWCRLQRVRLTPWEVDTLMAMDAAALAVHAEHERVRQQQRQAS